MEILTRLNQTFETSLQRAEDVLNETFSVPVHLQLLSLQALPGGSLLQTMDAQELTHRYAAVQIDFTGPVSGTGYLCLPIQRAVQLVLLLANDPLVTIDLNKVRTGTLTEIGSIVLSSVMSGLLTYLGSSEQCMRYFGPQYTDHTLSESLQQAMRVKTRCPTNDIGNTVVKAEIQLSTHFGIYSLDIAASLFIFFEQGISSYPVTGPPPAG